MKKILSLLGTITLMGTSTTSLVSCNTPQEYTKEQLEELKKENQINTANQEIKDNLEWIAPQEKPFNTVDNKWYFVIWYGNKNADWKIINFKNDIDLSNPAGKRNLDNLSGYNLNLTNSGIKGINLNIYKSGIVAFSHWWDKSDNYFKSVYRWNLNTNIPNLTVDSKTGEIKVGDE